jgi:predicted TPR repeat methyltransferase
MPHDPLACGDFIAARRHAYGKAAADDGDWAAAAEMFEQALERAPGWAPAWFALGEARERLGDRNGAIQAFLSTLTADPEDAQGAGPRLAFLGEGDALAALPEAYIARLFDDYAPRFDSHLTEALGYRAPALIVEALEEVAPGRRFADAFDLGCGTGLMGAAIRARVGRLTGVDLSGAMIAKARARGFYDTLIEGEALAALQGSNAGAFDLILAADALCYFGDLAPVFAAAERALAPKGLIAFSAETFVGNGFRLRQTMRFTHALGYLESVARAAGLELHIAREESIRREAGADAPSLIGLLQRPT